MSLNSWAMGMRVAVRDINPKAFYAALSIGVAAGLAGCSNQGLTTAATAPGAAGGPGNPSGLSAGGPGGGFSKAAAFDPFNEDGATDAPKRLQVIKNPTIAQIMKVGALPDMVMGPADAPVTIIKYASLTCPFCRKFQRQVFPLLKRDYIDTGKVRYIIREFPIGRQSGLATVAWRCAGPKKFFELYEEFLFNQRRWVSQEVRSAPILKVAAKMGMTRAKFDSCQKNQGMVEGLKWVKERGRVLGVIGTPNFFINGKLVKRRVGLKELRAIIDPLLSNKVVQQ